MPVAANFVVVVGSEVQDVAAEGELLERGFDFQMPSNYFGSSRIPAILQFMTHPSREPEGEFQFQFRINGHFVYLYGPSTADFVRCFHVVIGSAVLNGGANTLTVTRLHGEGTLGVSSAVIWYNTIIDATNPVRGKSATSKTAPKRTARKKTKGRPAKKRGSRRGAR